MTRVLAALAALGLLLAAPRAQFVVPEGSHYHNGSGLPLQDDGTARPLLSRLQQALVLGDADDAAWVVRTLRADPRPRLLPFGKRTHVAALDLATRLVAGSDLPGLRETIEREAREAVAAARERRDLDALVDLATRGTGLEASREAGLAAARLSFERGEWWAAAALAERAGDAGAPLAEAARSQLPADPSPSPPGGDVQRWRWSHAFGRRLMPTPPRFSIPAVLDGREDELLVFDGLGLLGVRRNLVPGASPMGGRWRRVRLADNHITWVEETHGDQEWLISSLKIPQPYAPPHPSRHASVRQGDRIVTAFNVVPRLLAEPEDHYAREAYVIAFDVERGARPVWIAAGADEAEEPISTAFGPPTIDGDRVFVQLFRIGLPSEVSLVGFDLATGERLFETPLVRGDPVDRFSSRRAETDSYWEDKRAREGPVAVRDGVVYACTGFGVIAAVDGVSGRILHTFHYDRRFSLDPEVYDPAFLFDTGGWEDEPVRLYGDRVVIAPSDSRYLYTLAQRPGPRGQLILDDPLERLDRRHVLALEPDPEGSESPVVLLSRIRDGRFGLVRVGPDGHVRAVSPSLPADEWVDHRGLGRPDLLARPVVMGDMICVPTSAGVRTYRRADLGVAPGLLDRPEGLPPPMSLHAVADGLVALTPIPIERQMYVESWAPAP